MFSVKFPELSKKVKNNTRVRKRNEKIKNCSAATSIMKRIALLSKNWFPLIIRDSKMWLIQLLAYTEDQGKLLAELSI